MSGLPVILNNPFYIGLIRLRRTGETLPGGHQPLITKSLFDRVQSTLRNKTSPRPGRHPVPFRRLLTCAVRILVDRRDAKGPRLLSVSHAELPGYLGPRGCRAR